MESNAILSMTAKAKKQTNSMITHCSEYGSTVSSSFPNTNTINCKRVVKILKLLVVYVT